MSNGTQPPIRNLPVFDTIVGAYKFVFGNLTQLARAAAIPAVLYAIAMGRLISASADQALEALTIVVCALLIGGGFLAFAVQCHRFYLNLTPDSAPRWGLPLGHREIAYLYRALGVFVLIPLLFASPSLLAFLVSGAGSGTESANGAVTFLVMGWLISLYVQARMIPALPAAAIGYPSEWLPIWRATHGNGMKLIAVAFLSPLPLWLCGLLLRLVSRVFPEPIGIAVELGLGVFLLFVEIAVFAVAISAAYKYLVIDAGPRPRVSLQA